MDTETINSKLPALHEPWRSPRERLVGTGVNLELYELEYTSILAAPREDVAHQYTARGRWNREAMLERFRGNLIRSAQQYQREPNETNYTIQSLLFQMPGGEFVMLFGNTLEVFARTPERAWELGESFRGEFRMVRSVKPHFNLLKVVRRQLESEFVPLPKCESMPEELLKLYYGDDIASWEQSVLEGMGNRHCGITILQGPPGTGKTSYLRNFMTNQAGKLWFYFIPSSNFDVLRESEFASFWSAQRSQSKDQPLVIVLEDAEAILGTRANDNRAAISNLLNITDGLLGDFLRIHLICTMNCEMHDLDPAILRPGRLVARRHFGLVPRARALALLQHLELPAPKRHKDAYSLAELFHEPEENLERAEKRVLGFAA